MLWALVAVSSIALSLHPEEAPNSIAPTIKNDNPSGNFPGGTVPPDQEACPCGTNPTGDNPAGTCPGGGCTTTCAGGWIKGKDATGAAEEGSEEYMEGQFTQTECVEYVRKHEPTANAATMSIGATEANKGYCYAEFKASANPDDWDDWDSWQVCRFDGAKLATSTKDKAAKKMKKMKAAAVCCVCKGGWMGNYDADGDGAHEKYIDGSFTRPECIRYVKEHEPTANAATMSQEATDTVKGYCYAEFEAGGHPDDWHSSEHWQVCLFDGTKAAEDAEKQAKDKLASKP